MKILKYILGIGILFPISAYSQVPVDFSQNINKYYNQSNGVAPLDSNKMMSAAVSGDVSSGIVNFTVYPISSIKIVAGGAGYKVGDTVIDGSGYVTKVATIDSNGGVTSLTPVTTYTLDGNTSLLRASTTSGSGYNLAYNFIYSSPTSNSNKKLIASLSKNIGYNNLNNYLNFDGSDSLTDIAGLMYSLPNNSGYNINSIVNTIDVTKSGYNQNKNIVVYDYKNHNNYYGDGTMLVTLDQGLSHRRYIESNTNWVASDLFSYTYGYTGPAHPDNQHNIWVSTTTGKDHLGNIVKSRGNVGAFGSDFYSYGVDDADSFDTNGSFVNYRYGTNWQWANLSVIQEFAPDPFIFHNTAEWLGEWDWGGWGEDGGPNNNKRNSLMITGWQVGGGYNHNWAASTVYNVGDQIQVTVNGILCSANVTVAGTSGTTTPDWSTSFANGESVFSSADPSKLPTVTDGSVTWRYNGIMRMSIDNGVVISYQPDQSNNQDIDLPTNSYGKRTPFVYHSAIKTDALYDNAILDFANAQWLLNKTAIFARLPKDFYTDVSAVYNNKSSYNVNLWGYDSSISSLTFKHSGTTVFSLSTTGIINANSITTNGESHFSLGQFTDPDVGSTRDAKFGSKGIAVAGGTKTDTLKVTKNLYLGAMTKANILAITDHTEGQKVFDTDDHEEVTFRCPTTSTCGWYPVQYGSALSN